MILVCIYDFRSDHLLSDNQFVCSSLEKTISPTLSNPELPVVLCAELRPRGFSQSTSASLARGIVHMALCKVSDGLMSPFLALSDYSFKVGSLPSPPPFIFGYSGSLQAPIIPLGPLEL